MLTWANFRGLTKIKMKCFTSDFSFGSWKEFFILNGLEVEVALTHISPVRVLCVSPGGP